MKAKSRNDENSMAAANSSANSVRQRIEKIMSNPSGSVTSSSEIRNLDSFLKMVTSTTLEWGGYQSISKSANSVIESLIADAGNNKGGSNGNNMNGSNFNNNAESKPSGGIGNKNNGLNEFISNGIETVTDFFNGIGCLTEVELDGIPMGGTPIDINTSRDDEKPIDHNNYKPSTGSGNPHKILDNYLAGKSNDEEANKALQELANASSYKMQEYATNLGKNYERHDDLILGWVEYYNNSSLTKDLNLIIDPNTIKAMVYKESKMGYAISWSSSPNANVDKDIMQVLDPRNPTIYEFANVDPKGGAGVYIHNEFKEYKRINKIDIKYTPNKGTNMNLKYAVADRLFEYKPEEDMFYYQYDQSSTTLSVGLGVRTFILKYANSGSYTQAIRDYNVAHAVQYERDVMAIVNGGYNTIDYYN